MRAERRAIADSAHAVGRAHDQALTDRLARFRNLEPETGELLGVLVRASRALRVLEIGTSNGYSTLWLADAAQSIGGHVESLEIEPARTELARDLIERAGVQDAVTLRSLSAGPALREYDDGAWELVFLDAERPEYVAYWEDLRRVIAPGGLLAVDNAISHAHELTEFAALVEAEPALTSSLVPIGAGLLLAVLARSAAGRPVSARGHPGR